MTSAAKAPYLATFRVRYLGIKKLEEEACKFKEPLAATPATSEITHEDQDQVPISNNIFFWKW